MRIGDIFRANSADVWETMSRHGSSDGYSVPNYQREYRWDKENIDRLIYDCLKGFYNPSEPEGTFTFLGTLILVRGRGSEGEDDIQGTSWSIVDGQQRLTTLVLISCALIERMRRLEAFEIHEDYKDSIRRKIQYTADELYECALGNLSARGQTYPYPRIVRDGIDIRAREQKDANYESAIANFLIKFSSYYCSDLQEFDYEEDSSRRDRNLLHDNYTHIKEKIYELFNPDESENTGHGHLPQKEFKEKPFRSLFNGRSNGDVEDNKMEQIFSYIASEATIDPLIRTVLFSSYFLHRVILAHIEADDQGSAFSIFDSLNTTGEPLTALETLKPLIVKFETSRKYENSKSKLSYDRIDESLNTICKDDSNKRQKETKELLISCALYITGEKLSEKIRDQSEYLRKYYQKITNKRRFIELIEDMARFRKDYWHKEGIRCLTDEDSDSDQETLDSIQLCMSLISDTNTSLALPIIARYRSQYDRQVSETNESFVNAIKALTAFIILRRSVTESTASLDAIYRALMTNLCVGINTENSILEISKLKLKLIKTLEGSPTAIYGKFDWVKKVSEQPFQGKKHLAKFLILAAAHKSEIDKSNPGLLMRKKTIRRSDERDHLTYRKWKDETCKTIEHIAPVSPQNGWDTEIYNSQFLKDFLGKMILLPAKENARAGNKSWPIKKTFYRALIAHDKDEAKEIFAKAKKDGYLVPKKTEKLVLEGGRLALLDPISEVESWSADLIRKRTKNIAELAWDTIAPWLYDDSV